MNASMPCDSPASRPLNARRRHRRSIAINATITFVAAAIAACGGGDAIVRPQSLAPSPAQAVAGETSVLAATLERFERDVCSVRPALSQRRELGTPMDEAELLQLSALAGDMCVAELRQVDVGFDPRGEPALLGDGNGILMSSEQAFLFTDFGSESIRARFDGVEGAASDQCGGNYISREPVYSITPVDVSNGFVTIQNLPEHTALFVGSAGCVTADSEMFELHDPARLDLYLTSPHPLPPTGSFNIGISSTLGTSDRSAVRSWAPGAGQAAQQTLSIGPYSREADSLSSGASWCNGYINDVPTMLVDVIQPNYGEIRFSSPVDTVIAVRRPDGTVTCNDDYYGLNPAISDYFYVGVHEVYVGTYSASVVAQGQLILN